MTHVYHKRSRKNDGATVGRKTRGKGVKRVEGGPRRFNTKKTGISRFPAWSKGSTTRKKTQMGTTGLGMALDLKRIGRTQALHNLKHLY